MSNLVSPRSLHRRIPLPHRPPWVVTVLGRSIAGFWRQNAMGMAGMIAFFGFLSLVPLVLLLLAFLGEVLGSAISARDVQHLFHAVVPGLSQHQFLATYWHPIRHSRVATTILGSVSLLLGTLGLHDSVDWAVNRLWQAQGGRPFWVAKLRGIAVIVWVSVFAVFSLAVGWLWAVLLGAVHLPSTLEALGVVALVPSLLVDVAIFGALYRLTPAVDVDLLPAVVGGLVGATLWEASKVLFGWWVLEVASYNRVYGPLAASVIVMLWLWISAMIFLYGAEVSHVVQGMREEAREAAIARSREAPSL